MSLTECFVSSVAALLLTTILIASWKDISKIYMKNRYISKTIIYYAHNIKYSKKYVFRNKIKKKQLIAFRAQIVQCLISQMLVKYRKSVGEIVKAKLTGW